MKKTTLAVISLIIASACASPRVFVPAEYPLLNPLLAAGTVFDFAELKPFNYKIQSFIDKSKREGLTDHVTVYFRDLENGPIKGVNYDDKFTPASLLKVPMLMAALKHAEKSPEFLMKKTKFDIPTRSQSYLTTRGLFPGTEYTMEEVVRALIVHSDNDALSILASAIPVEEQDEVFRDFGLIIPQVRSLEDSMTVREYASFFRILYNASYLDKKMSQKALEYLAASEFKGGIDAGVPEGVAVAHKYGERYYFEGKAKQLHDCGIVYHPKRHYVLCVMTRGDDFEKLSRVIREISAIAYKEVDAPSVR